MIRLVAFIFLCFLVHTSYAGGPTKGFQYTSVGGSGSYPRVTNMVANSGVWNVCPTNVPTCTTQNVNVAGSLAPFNEDQTIALRGPCVVHNIAVYTLYQSTFSQIAYWDSSNTKNKNIAWMNNAGDWSVCQGSAQSYMAADGKSAATSATNAFNGALGCGTYVNVMSAQDCTSTTCPGFIRGVDKVGFKGNNCGEKMIVVSMTMQHDTSGSDCPALWLLNGNVVRTNQWGCNCRGMGAAGGCGELDCAEVIPNQNSEQCTTTLYSFKNSMGSADYFARPTTTPCVFMIIFDAIGAGTITILQQPSFSFASSILKSTIQSLISSTTLTKIDLGNPYTGPACTVTSADSVDISAENNGSPLPAAAIAGIAVGIILAITIMVVVIVVVVRRLHASPELA